jgi:hypothetical protein
MMDSTKHNRQKGEDKQGPSGLPKSSHLQDSIQSHWKTSKSEIFIFLLMQETVIPFKRIFRGSPSFFSRTITKENSLYGEEKLWSTFRESFEGHRLPSLEGHKTESSEK